MTADDVSLAPLPTAPVHRIAFLGTPELAAGVLETLIQAGFEIAVVVTRKDKRRGRGSGLVASPVKRVAEANGLRVVHDVDDLLTEHRNRPIELGVVVAFGSLVKPHVLAAIPMVNLHVSLLPRWRGAAPIERALLAGDVSTGVCLMQLDVGLDTGGVISSASMPIESSTTAAEIGARLMAEGGDLLLSALRTGRFVAQPQEGEPTYAAKIEPVERRIDWTESATMVSRRVRIGGAWTIFRDRRLKILSVDVLDGDVPAGRVDFDGVQLTVGCGQGSVRLLEVQPEGKPRIGAVDWARGARLGLGESMIDR